jgi:hypothetical protein
MRLMAPPLPAASRPVAAVHDPVVHLHEFALEAEELTEVAVARGGGIVGVGRPGRGAGFDVLPVLAFHFELLVIVVDQLLADTLGDVEFLLGRGGWNERGAGGIFGGHGE